MTADQVIAAFTEASTRRVFPAHCLELTLEEIQDAARRGDRVARRALKLLNDKRFDKR
jgi:hypothetical protein